MDYVVIFDGGKNRNGTYYSFLIFEGKSPIRWDKKVEIDVNSNNEAEYTALIRALDALLELGIDKALILGDSRLVINQVNGLWKVTANNLVPFHAEASKKFEKLNDSVLVWWPDDQTKQFLGH